MLNTDSFSFNDNYVAVGGTGGHIFLLNAVTGQTGNPMKSATVSSILFLHGREAPPPPS
jgi:hypothetical protein